MPFNPIIQWNLCGFFHKFAELKLLCRTHRPSFVLLQETNLSPVDSPSFRSYSIIRADRTNAARASGGVAIMIHESLDFHPIPLNTDLEAVAVRSHIHCPVTVCCVYLPPSIEISPESLLNLISQLPPPIVLGGDFNAHHPSWGSTTCNHKGQITLETMERANLHLLNTGEHTHLCLASGTLSSIDLTIVSPSLFPILSWTPLPDLHGSDHFPILISSTLPSSQSPLRTTYKLYKADWELYQSSVVLPETALRNPSLNLCRLKAAIRHAASLSIPQRNSHSTHFPVPWWNDRCSQVIRDRKRALAQFRSSPSLERFMAFKRARAVARKTIVQAKASSWVNFTKNLDYHASSDEFWNRVGRLKGRPPNVISGLYSGSAWCSDPTLIPDILAQHFASVSNNTDHPGPSAIPSSTLPPSLPLSNSDSLPINLPFTFEELSQALNRHCPSTPGPDEIPFPLIKKLPYHALSFLLDIYNDFWTLGLFPPSWSHSTLIPICKKGKPRSSPSSYRPISLTDHLSKIFERMILNRLSWSLETNSQLSSIQCGFRPGRSTLNHLVGFEKDIRNAFAAGQHLIALSLDLQNAFDRVSRELIITRLLSLGYVGNILIFVRNFLNNRSFRVCSGGFFSSAYSLHNGVPQGSVLSPTLFIIAMDSITNYVDSRVTYRLFADDILVYRAVKSINWGERLLQGALYRLSVWSSSTGFCISPPKSSIIHVCRRRGCHRIHSFTINDVSIPTVDQFRFLGVIFDRRLTWKNHIDELKSRCTRDLFMLRWLSHHRAGANQETIIKVYLSIILPKMDYGSLLYSAASKSYLRTLEVIQNSALRISLGAFKSSPAISLCSLTSTIPLTYRRKHISLRFAVRSIALPSSFGLTSHWSHPTASDHPPPTQVSDTSSIISGLLSDVGFSSLHLLPVQFPRFPPWTFTDTFVNTSLSLYSKGEHPPSFTRAKFYELLSQYPEYKTLYTDGSKSSAGLGCAFVSDGRTFPFRLAEQGTILTAELYAIYQALIYVSAQTYRKWLIFTDSYNSLVCLIERKYSHPLVSKSLILLRSLILDGYRLVLTWIPSHVGIPGNELADAAAKSATILQLPLINICIHTDLYPIIKTFIRDTVQCRWELESGTNKLSNIKSDFFSLLPVPPVRSHAVRLNRLRLGHCYFTHGHMMSSDQPANCEFCAHSPASVLHLLSDCPRLSLTRIRFGLSNFRNTLVGDNSDRLMGFLREIGYFYRI